MPQASLTVRWKIAWHSIVCGQNLLAAIPSYKYGAKKTSPPSLQAHITGCYGISWGNTLETLSIIPLYNYCLTSFFANAPPPPESKL